MYKYYNDNNDDTWKVAPPPSKTGFYIRNRSEGGTPAALHTHCTHNTAVRWKKRPLLIKWASVMWKLPGTLQVDENTDLLSNSWLQACIDNMMMEVMMMIMMMRTRHGPKTWPAVHLWPEAVSSGAPRPPPYLPPSIPHPPTPPLMFGIWAKTMCRNIVNNLKTT